MIRVAIWLNVVAIVANVFAFVINMVAGNVVGCLIALALIAACTACIMVLRK